MEGAGLGLEFGETGVALRVAGEGGAGGLRRRVRGLGGALDLGERGGQTATRAFAPGPSGGQPSRGVGGKRLRVPRAVRVWAEARPGDAVLSSRLTAMQTHAHPFGVTFESYQASELRIHTVLYDKYRPPPKNDCRRFIARRRRG